MNLLALADRWHIPPDELAARLTVEGFREVLAYLTISKRTGY
jgi:hypothetical protein